MTPVRSDTHHPDSFSPAVQQKVHHSLRIKATGIDPESDVRQRGLDRLPDEAAYLADRYGDSDHPEAATFATRLQAAADGRPVNEFEEVI